MLNTREEQVGFEGAAMPSGPRRCDLDSYRWSGLGSCAKHRSCTLPARSNQVWLFWGT